VLKFVHLCVLQKEIEVERNEDEEERAEHGLENSAAPPIPTRKPAERSKHEADG
jgi:hypothetical protein